MLGAMAIHLPRRSALCDETLRKTDGKRHYVRGIVRQDGGIFRVSTTGSQSSGVLTSLLKANCLIILPEETSEVRAGEQVTIELLPTGEFR
jgi:molybdopterin molybdotransferase